MADDNGSDDIKETDEPKPKAKQDNGKICRTALKRYSSWHERERENTDAAYADLAFCWDDAQWPDAVVRERAAPGNTRPMLTVNTLPQFVHQVTGSMRKSQPSIKVVPVDSGSDPTTAETIGGMIRYVENRSDAPAIYTGAADSQVSCGIGAWRVNKEYAAESTFNQELRVVGVDDAVAIAWDPESVLPTREDAQWCIVPVDISKESFEEKYPDAPMEDFDDVVQNKAVVADGWLSSDSIRVAEYWVKKPIKRTLALMPDGSIEDLTNSGIPPNALKAMGAGTQVEFDKGLDPQVMQTLQNAKRIEARDGFKVCRYLITAAHVLETTEWPGMHIPIIPVIGEEIRIGRKVVRRGLIKSAKDPQRMLNYYFTAHTEVVALQPKAPFIGTEKNFEKYQAEWARANTDATPYLPYQPDPANGGQAPQRVPPPVASQGIIEGITLANEYIKSVIGIYDPSLGNKSTEVSGKAILARENQGDTGTAIYPDNWNRAIRRTGQILIDLIPHVYDTERMIRIMGEDGKVDLKWINRPVGVDEIDPKTGQPKEPGTIENDCTKGAYDVVLEVGPSYSTKREEAKANMVEFIRSAPETAPAVMDLVAKAQDWPLSDEFGKRLEAIAPPPVQALIANQKKERGEEQPPPQPPSPEQQMQMQAMQADLQNKQLTNQKLQVEIQQMGQGAPADPHAMVRAQGEQQKNQIMLERSQIEHATMATEAHYKERLAAVQLETALVNLEIAKKGLVIDTASAALDVQSKQQGLEHDAQAHTASLVQGMESHQTGLQQGAEKHQAGIEAMQAKAQAQPDSAP